MYSPVYEKRKKGGKKTDATRILQSLAGKTSTGSVQEWLFLEEISMQAMLHSYFRV